MNTLTPELFEHIVKLALEEDQANHDATSLATINPLQCGEARIISGKEGIVSGIDPAALAFAMIDKDIRIEWQVQNGAAIHAGNTLAKLEGRLLSLLSAERTALNFLQHLSGIATVTSKIVQSLEGTSCKLIDTRKTTPGMRVLAKAAVEHGGGYNHRMGLHDAFLIKENHIAGCGSIADAIQRCRKANRTLAVEVECETLNEVREASKTMPDIILLDNMSPELVRQSLKLIPEPIIVEASGGISASNAREYAATGVHRIALGSITHSAPALDLSMLIAAA